MPWRWPWEEGLEWAGNFVSAKTDLRGAGKRQKSEWNIVLQEVVSEVRRWNLKMNPYDVDWPRAKLLLLLTRGAWRGKYIKIHIFENTWFLPHVSQYVKTQIMVNMTHVIANKSVWSVFQMIGGYSELLMNVLLFVWKGLLREWETGGKEHW